MIRIIIAPLLILALLSCNKQPAYVVAAMPVPVWNVSDISSLFGGNNRGTLVLDKQQQMLELEFVALPGSLFRIHGTVVSHGITMYRVTTNEYPCSDSKKYFIDAR